MGVCWLVIPVVGIRVTLIGGSFHSVDSSDLAFEQAATIAVEKAIKNAEAVLLEPIMRLQVVVPVGQFRSGPGWFAWKKGGLITGLSGLCKYAGD